MLRFSSFCISTFSKAFNRCMLHATRNNTTSAKQRPSFVDRNYGSKSDGLFSKNEMERRLSNLRSHMTNNNIGAVVMTSVHNIKYFSDYLYCSFGRPYGLVVTHDKCVLLAGCVDGTQPWRRSFCDVLTYTDWQRDNFVGGVKSLVENKRENIGFEYDHLTLDLDRKFGAALPDARKVDIGVATMEMRLLKSEEEQNVMREGARIADIGGAAGVEAFREGAQEWEVSENSTRAMVKEISRTFPHTEFKDTWSWLQSGINTDGCHVYPTTRQIKKGDICNLNCFPMISGYYMALERNLFLGYASEEHLRYWRINCEVHERGVALIQPGARCSDITKELNDIYAKYGLLDNRSFGYGHSFGIMSHYYGREAGVEFREDVDTILEPNMVVSMEPMIMIPDGQPGAGGYREHDMIIVKDDGAENITKFPYGPDKMIIQN